MYVCVCERCVYVCVSAVHMALVLFEMNLLFLPTSCQAPLCVSGWWEGVCVCVCVCVCV